MISWKRNLVFIWLSQFLSISGFAFSMPFTPFYLQDLGITDPVALKWWIALNASAAPLALAIFSPIWGTLADRYGRRIMMLRANAGAVVILSLMGFVTAPWQFILLRFLQGTLTGTMTAAQTMVAANTPRNRSGLALGTLSAAVFSGGMFGSFIGGIFADQFGYRNAFRLSGLIMVLSFILVLAGVREVFSAPDQANGTVPDMPLKRKLRPVLPILVLVLAIAFVRQFDNAFLPLLIQDIHGSIKGAATWTGSLGAFCGIAGLLSGIIIGRLADRIPPPRLGKISALCAGLLMIPQGLATGFLLLFGARFGMVFFAGGLDPVFQIWLSKVTPGKHRGTVFGFAGTAKSIGWILSPLAGGLVASGLNIRALYFISPVLFFMLIPMIGMVVKRLDKDR